MKYIDEFKENDRIVQHFHCKYKAQLKSKTGKAYLSLKLADKTGTIDAKVWELDSNIQAFEQGEFVKVDAEVTIYQGEPQMKVYKLRRSAEGEYDIRDYIPTTEKDVAEMYEEIKAHIESVGDQYMRSLLKAMLVEDEDLAEKLKTRSAAKNMHHNYLGGLLEHTLSVADLCSLVCSQYDFLNRDMLLTCALLHDIGKVWELSDFPDNDYTDEGQLIGHIVMGADMISEYSSGIPGFPAELRLLLRHCILAHHGEYEFGSPKLPQIIEAMFLHAADNLDAKAKAFRDATGDPAVTGSWTGYNRLFQRNLRKS